MAFIRGMKNYLARGAFPFIRSALLRVGALQQDRYIRMFVRMPRKLLIARMEAFDKREILEGVALGRGPVKLSLR
jgi:hypothetical protein